MGEYQYVLSRYQKYKRYRLNIALFSIVMIILAGSLVSLNFFRVSPYVIFIPAMMISLYYAKRIQVESKNFEKLKEYLKEHDPETLKNEELVFFIDYQLNGYFKKESDELMTQLSDSAAWNTEKAKQKLMEIITEIKNYYGYLTANSSLDEDIGVSLKWYRESMEKRKQDLV